VLDVAIDCGFRSHETFTRAFGRHFGVSPRDYRRHSEGLLGNSTGRYEDACAGESYEVSQTRVHTLERVHLACLRHVGSYEEVPDELYSRLDRWAHSRHVTGARRYLGIGHDAPGITPTDRLRFDAALIVPAPFESRGEVVHQTLEAGLFAVATHVGAYTTLRAAYVEIYGQAASVHGHRLVGLPVIEAYQTTQVDSQRAVNHTDIYIPVERVGS
jgi:AraC family transcriptional regulator